MAGPTLIQIKRSLNTGTNPTLANGELAYTANGDVLWIGSNAIVVPISGKRVPGVLTANQALVTNSTNMIDTVMVGNSTVNVVANSTMLKIANSTTSVAVHGPTTVEVAGQYYLKADGSWSTVTAGSAAPAGANTNIQYNDSGVTAGGNYLVFDKTTNNVTIANSVITGGVTHNTTGFYAGGNVFLDTAKLFIGNTTVNAFANSLLVQVSDTTGVANLKPGSLQVQANILLDSVKLVVGNSTVNSITNSTIMQVSDTTGVANLKSSSLQLQANVLLDTTKLSIGNSTVNAFANSLQIDVADTTGQANLKPGSLAIQANVLIDSVKVGIGNTTANLIANSIIVSLANSTGITNVQPTQVVAGNTTTSTTVGVAAVTVGNSTINAVVNSSAASLSNSTVTYSLVKPTAAQVSAANYYPASDSTWKQVVVSTNLDGLTDVVITTVSNNNVLVFDNTAVQWVNKATGNGFTFASQVPAVLGANGITVTTAGVNVLGVNSIAVTTTGVYVNVAANKGLLSDSTGLSVVAANGINLTAAGVNVTGANGISVTAAGVNVLANNGIVANTTGVFANIGTTLAFTSGAIGVNTNLSIQDLTLAGNLTITGTLATVDAVNLVVNDSIISLARNNAADVLDIGVYGQYNDGTERFTGLIWDTTSDVWELFANTTVEPTTTVDIVGTGYVHSTLYSYLKSGWGTGTLVANATGVTITGNTTYAVAITGNTMTLSTALAGTSGGTGLASYTSQDILVANTVNGFNKLGIGATGTVLQNVGGALAYDTLDGGTF